MNRKPVGRIHRSLFLFRAEQRSHASIRGAVFVASSHRVKGSFFRGSRGQRFLSLSILLAENWSVRLRNRKTRKFLPRNVCTMARRMCLSSTFTVVHARTHARPRTRTFEIQPKEGRGNSVIPFVTDMIAVIRTCGRKGIYFGFHFSITFLTTLWNIKS